MDINSTCLKMKPQSYPKKSFSLSSGNGRAAVLLPKSETWKLLLITFSSASPECLLNIFLSLFTLLSYQSLYISTATSPNQFCFLTPIHSMYYSRLILTFLTTNSTLEVIQNMLLLNNLLSLFLE